MIVVFFTKSTFFLKYLLIYVFFLIHYSKIVFACQGLECGEKNDRLGQRGMRQDIVPHIPDDWERALPAATPLVSELPSA